MKILHLTLTKQWFDLIASGQKKIEYREYKAHWVSRLQGKSEFKKYDEIYFINGYGKHRPYMRVELQELSIVEGRHIEPDNGELIKLEKKYFVIALGNILELGNIEG